MWELESLPGVCGHPSWGAGEPRSAQGRGRAKPWVLTGPPSPRPGLQTGMLCPWDAACPMVTAGIPGELSPCPAPAVADAAAPGCGQGWAAAGLAAPREGTYPGVSSPEAQEEPDTPGKASNSGQGSRTAQQHAGFCYGTTELVVKQGGFHLWKCCMEHLGGSRKQCQASKFCYFVGN